MAKTLTIEEYKKIRHSVFERYNIVAKCGKLLVVIKTTHGFRKKSGFYISPYIPMNDITDQTAIRKTQEEVIQYIESEGWNDYAKMIKNKKC